MKNSGAYKIIITQLVFAFIVVMVSVKPAVNYINHIFNHNDDDIELCEDFDEEDASEEVFDFVFDDYLSTTIVDVTSIQKKSRKKSTDKLLNVLLDVPIPPPKQV